MGCDKLYCYEFPTHGNQSACFHDVCKRAVGCSTCPGSETGTLFPTLRSEVFGTRFSMYELSSVCEQVVHLSFLAGGPPHDGHGLNGTAGDESTCATAAASWPTALQTSSAASCPAATQTSSAASCPTATQTSSSSSTGSNDAGVQTCWIIMDSPGAGDNADDIDDMVLISRCCLDELLAAFRKSGSSC